MVRERVDDVGGVPDEPGAEFEYRHVLDGLADPVVAADSSQYIVYANHATSMLLGWNPDELIGQPLVTIVPPRFRATHVAAFDAFVRTGHPKVMGHPLRVPALKRDGTEVDIELALNAFPFPSPNPMVIASMRDLSERVELERQLEVTRHLRAVSEMAARLTSLLDLQRVLQTVTGTLVSEFDSALARVWLYNADTNTLRLEANAGTSQRPEEPLFSEIDVATYPYKLAEVARSRTPFVSNHLGGDPQIDEGWVRREHIQSMAAFPLLYGTQLLGVLVSYSRQALPDEIVEALATFAAITTTAIHDVQLFQQEQRFRLEAEAAEHRAAFLAEAGSVLASSLDYETTLGNVAQLAVMNLADWCVVEEVEATGVIRRVAIAHINPERIVVVEEFQRRFPQTQDESVVRRVVDSGESIMVPRIDPEQLERSARGAEHLQLMRDLAPLSFMCVPLIAHSRTLGAISFLTGEGSGRVYGPADLALAEDLASRAAVAMENSHLYSQLEEAIRVRDEFLSSVSHDLKNPLATIKARAQVLRRRVGHLPEDQQERFYVGLDSIDTTAGKMTRLIDDLVDVVHLRIGRPLTLRYEDVDLVKLVRQVVSEQQSTLRRRLTFQSSLEELPAALEVARSARVLVNLISNAAKYSPEGREITVTLERETASEEPMAVISVIDQGIGIPAADLPHVFERFFRASNAGDVEGSGIGLAGALQIVEHHGGTMEVRSQEGEGTTFTARLPLAEPAA
jgi:PAS domain S-box-containing protein